MGFLLPICATAIFTVLLTTSQVNARMRSALPMNSQMPDHTKWAIGPNRASAPDNPATLRAQLRHALKHVAHAGPDDDDDDDGDATPPYFKSLIAPVIMQSVARNLPKPWQFGPPPKAGFPTLLRGLVNAFKYRYNPTGIQPRNRYKTAAAAKVSLVPKSKQYLLVDSSKVPLLRQKHSAPYDLPDSLQMPIVRNAPNMHKYRFTDRSEKPIIRNVPNVRKSHVADLPEELDSDDLPPMATEEEFHSADSIGKPIYDNAPKEQYEIEFRISNPEEESVSDNPSSEKKFPAADLVRESGSDGLSQVTPVVKFRVADAAEKSNAENLSPEKKLSVIVGDSGAENLSPVSPKMTIRIADPIGEIASKNLSTSLDGMKFRVTDVVGEFVADNLSPESPEIKSFADTPEETAVRGASSASEYQTDDLTEESVENNLSSGFGMKYSERHDPSLVPLLHHRCLSPFHQQPCFTDVAGGGPQLQHRYFNGPPSLLSFLTPRWLSSPQYMNSLRNSNEESESRAWLLQSPKRKHRYVIYYVTPRWRWFRQYPFGPIIPRTDSSPHMSNLDISTAGNAQLQYTVADSKENFVPTMLTQSSPDAEYGVGELRADCGGAKMSQALAEMKPRHLNGPSFISSLKHSLRSLLYDQLGPIMSRVDSLANEVKNQL